MAAILAVASIATPAFGVSGGTQPAAIASDPSAPVPDAAAAMDGEFRMSDGSEVTIVSDDQAEGERVVIGRTVTGDLVQYKIQSTSVTESDRIAMQQDLLEPTDPGSETYGETESIAETFEVASSPLSTDLTWTPASVVASTSDQVIIAWSEPAFTAAVPGVVEASTDDGEVVLDGLEPESPYTATLTATVDGPDATQLERQRVVEIETLPEAGTVGTRTYQKYTTAYVHKTFIPDAKISAAICKNLQTAYTFGGDNRTYQLPSLSTPGGTPNYRTMMFANVNWSNPAPYNFIWSRGVGPSKIYKNGVLNQTLYASTSSMLVKSIQVGSSYAKAYFDHSATNPFCKFFDVNYGGLIRYAEWVEFYRSGTVAVDGYRFKAPAHEMYGRFNTATYTEVWKTITRRPNEGFQCLLGNGACGMDFYDVSASYQRPLRQTGAGT